MSSVKISRFHLSRPHQIRWWFPDIKPGTEPWEYIAGKNLRKQLKNYQQIVNEKKISWELRPLPFAEFTSWLSFYRQRMEELGYEIIASEERFKRYLSEGKKIYTLDVFIQGELVGRKLTTIKDDLAVSCFKASKHVPNVARHCSFGALIDYLQILSCRENHAVKRMCFGRSRNQFGLSNKLGYLEHKLRFGQIPTVANEAELLKGVELNDEKYILFYALDRQKNLKLYAFPPSSENKQYVAIYSLAEITELKSPKISN